MSSGINPETHEPPHDFLDSKLTVIAALVVAVPLAIGFAVWHTIEHLTHLIGDKE